MTRCVDKSAGELLHAYELGILGESECERFEKHLLECDHCGRSLDRFEERVSILASSPKVRAVVASTLRKPVTGESTVGRLWRYLWPQVPILFRPAVSYLVLLLIAIPAFLAIQKPAPPVTVVSQFAHLSPIRSSTNILDRNISGTALLTFEFDSYEVGHAYAITIESESGTVVYRSDQFTSFDEREVGTLSLPISEMDPGNYWLVISDPENEDQPTIHTYLFRITALPH